MNFTWLWDIFRTILSLIDTLVYWLIELLISLFDQLANVRLFSDDVLKVFASRIYFLVSIVMVFKVSFSIIQYIINPDSISNNERGMGKLIQSVLLSLVCLVGVNYVFNFAYDLQNTILKSHIIEKLILGVDEGLTANQQADVKSKIPYSLLTSFVRPNVNEVDLFGYDSDIGTYYCVTDSNYRNNKDQWIYMYKYDSTSSTVDDETNYVLTNYNEQFGNCIENGAGNNSSNNRTFKTKDGEISGKMYNYATQTNNYDLLLKLVNDKYKSETYIFEYKFIISTVAGVFVGIMYLNFCIDLAIRVSKFGFLQLIAPIPILSMIDPKSAKNGMMSKWVKNCINTYLGLFIRIAAVSFVIFIVNIIFTTNITDSGSGMEVGIFIKIVILFGGLLFAKEIPKLITDLTGIDMKGDFKMNPFSRIPGAKIGGALAGGIAGIGGSFIGGGLKTVGSALGSLAQAGYGAAKGNGWNYNSDRVANAWRNTGHSVGTRSVRALNDVKKNMHIPGKDISEPFGEKSNSEYWRTMKHGENLDEKIRAGKKIYSNDEFEKEISKYSSLKQQLGEAKAAAELLAKDPNTTPEQLSKANKEVADLEKQSDMVKERIEKMGAQTKYKNDYRNYKDLKTFRDYNGGSTSNTQTYPTSGIPAGQSGSTPSYNATANAQQQVSSGGTPSSNSSSNPYDSVLFGGSGTSGSMPSVGTHGQMPTVGGNNNSQNNSGNNTGGSMPSVGGNNSNP